MWFSLPALTCLHLMFILQFATQPPGPWKRKQPGGGRPSGGWAMLKAGLACIATATILWWTWMFFFDRMLTEKVSDPA